MVFDNVWKRFFGAAESQQVGDFRQRMSADWESRARENALHYIADFKPEWTDIDEFFQTGLDDTRKFLGEAGWTPELTAGKRLLEIGCGVGRMTRHLAGQFGEVVGIDISPTMIEQARRFHPDATNMQFAVSNGATLDGFADQSFDFVLSYIVFQHIPHESIIYSYISEGLRVLAPGGRFRFQARNDFAHAQPDTYSGASIRLDEVEQIAANSNCKVLNVQGQGTGLCYVEIQKTAK